MIKNKQKANVFSFQIWPKTETSKSNALWMLFINSEKLLEVKDCAFHNLKSDLLMSIMEKKKKLQLQNTQMHLKPFTQSP